MSKDEEQQKPPFLFYLIILTFIIVVGLNFAGDYQLREQGTDDPQVQANMDNIAFLLEQSTKVTDRHDYIVDKITGLIRNNSDLRQEMESQDELIITEIVKIKQDIKNKFPQASDVVDEGQSVIADTPFLTLKMDKSEFLLGEKITFSGMAQPSHPVILTLKLPDRTLDSVAVSKTAIINGEYTVDFQTRFDSPKGIWQVYARQLDDQTKTLTFTVE